MFLYRDHKGGLSESMKTIREFKSHGELELYLKSIGYTFEKLEAKPYEKDYRIMWDTWIVTIDGEVVGFSNGPII